MLKDKKMGIRNKSSKSKHRFAAYLRRNLTFPERLLWNKLKDNKLGVRFASQQLVYGFCVDEWCPRAKLCVEVDGPHHANQKAYDVKRDEILAKRGIETMRFDVVTIENSLPAVVAIIEDRVRRRLS